MDVNSRNRTELKSYFLKNSIPTESNFAELIDGMINQKDDGVVKLAGNPLSIEAVGDDNSSKKTINFYRDFKSPQPDWVLNLSSGAVGNNAAKPGFNISNGAGNSRLFIDSSNGNIGIGTTDASAAKLVINGGFKASANVSGNHDIAMEAPADGKHRIDPETNEEAYQTGLVYRVTQNPPNGAPIFQVRSQAQAVRLFVDHNGWTGSRHNSAWFEGPRENYFASDVRIGTDKDNIGTVKATNNPLVIRAKGTNQHLIGFEDPQGNVTWNINQNVGGKNPGLNFSESDVSKSSLFIKSGGNVGIGTTDPKAKLDIKATETTVNGWYEAVRFSQGAHSAMTHPDGGLLFGLHGNRRFYFGDINGGKFRKYVMVIDASTGSVGLGTDDPDKDYTLDVTGIVRTNFIKIQGGSFKVDGDFDKFYPVVFNDQGWHDGIFELEIVRASVHIDSQWRGALLSKFTCHSSAWGHGADFTSAEIHQSRQIFVSEYRNIYKAARFIVWLRGGGTTYYWRSNHPASLENAEAKQKTYNDEKLDVLDRVVNPNLNRDHVSTQSW